MDKTLRCSDKNGSLAAPRSRKSESSDRRSTETLPKQSDQKPVKVLSERATSISPFCQLSFSIGKSNKNLNVEDDKTLSLFSTKLIPCLDNQSTSSISDTSSAGKEKIRNSHGHDLFGKEKPAAVSQRQILGLLDLPADLVENIRDLCACDGLILFYTYSQKYCNLGICGWLARREKLSVFDLYSLGCTREYVYKVLRFTILGSVDHIDDCDDFGPEAEIYEVSSHRWKALEMVYTWGLYKEKFVVLSVGGNSFWLGEWFGKNHVFVQSFNFSSESFRLLNFLFWLRQRITPQQVYLVSKEIRYLFFIKNIEKLLKYG